MLATGTGIIILLFLQRHHEKTGLFNLEDEELTHFGQSLGDLKHFDDHVMSDDDEEKDHGNSIKDVSICAIKLWTCPKLTYLSQAILLIRVAPCH